MLKQLIVEGLKIEKSLLTSPKQMKISPGLFSDYSDVTPPLQPLDQSIHRDSVTHVELAAYTALFYLFFPVLISWADSFCSSLAMGCFVFVFIYFSPPPPLSDRPVLFFRLIQLNLPLIPPK